nr:hypothetical protein [Brevibacillus nitrificans]
MDHPSKTVSESRTVMTDLVFPPDTWVHKTSMEVFVKVESENLLTAERRLTARAYLTFIALDDEGKPTTVPQVIPETDEEKSQYEHAEERYHIRKKRRAEKVHNDAK